MMKKTTGIKALSRICMGCQHEPKCDKKIKARCHELRQIVKRTNETSSQIY